uniref:TonB-dependent receptor n=1 Tax=Bellilinea caldifistulae TaxID=360411 RepID=A0A7C4KXQ5_9CHLR
MLNDRNWLITETCFDLARQNHAETIFTIGNGYLGTRGAHEERYPGEERTTFIHGVFDDVPIVFTELVNAPDWLDLNLWLGGEPFRLTEGEILVYQRQLDLRTGRLSRRVEWRSPQGMLWQLAFERFASLANPHLLCQRVTIKALENTNLEARTTLSGETDNLNYKHWDWIGQGFGQNSAWLHLRTRSSGIELGAATRLVVSGGGNLQQSAWDTRNAPTLVVTTQLKSGEIVEIEKITAFYTSRETNDPQGAARRALETLPKRAWKGLWESHARAWQREWERCDVLIEGDDRAHLAVRFSLFQLLAAAPRQDERVSIGAKALSGYGYRGHVFWDTEIFMLPFFTYTRPEIARNLLSYRYHTLEGARKKARENGYKGAQYAWESAATGEEVTPTWVPHPSDRTQLIRIWTGDIQIHISADVCYAIWQYWQATGDDDFMIHRGAEIFLDVARFWASRAEWNAETGCYEFTDVIGGSAVKGNPELRIALIKNYDFRWEWFLGNEDMVAFSAFYKYITDAIEPTIQPTTQLRESFTNAKDAWLKGFEVELRKNLGFITQHLRHFAVTANYIYADSETEVEPSAGFVPTTSKRPLVGQPENTVNVSLEYHNPDLGFTGRFMYRYTDDRVNLIGGLGLPDVIEKENDTFDIVLIQKLGKHWEVKLTGQNLNNEPYTLLQGNGIYHYYKTGRTFKLGVSWTW